MDRIVALGNLANTQCAVSPLSGPTTRRARAVSSPAHYFITRRANRQKQRRPLRRLKLAPPIRIIKPLTDNGSQFAHRFATKDRKPSGQHAFDKDCTAMGIEHRLAPSRHPQTNGRVERFNGRSSELLQQTRLDSLADMEVTLLTYLKLYNHQIPHRVIGAPSPI